MPHLTRAQLARRRRVESLISLAAPALDLLLFAGDRVSRVAGRREIPPEPARRVLSPSAGGATKVT